MLGKKLVLSAKELRPFDDFFALRLPLLFSLLGSYLLPGLFPSVRFIGFAPLLTLVISRMHLSRALWLSLLVGLIIDLYSKSPFGFSSLNYTLTTLILYRYRKLFLEEKVWTFALFSVLFSFVSTWIHFVLYALIDIRPHLRLPTLFLDTLVMPVLDGFYALIVILLPLKLYSYLRESEKMLFYRRLSRRCTWIILKTLKKMRLLSHE